MPDVEAETHISIGWLGQRLGPPLSEEGPTILLAPTLPRLLDTTAVCESVSKFVRVCVYTVRMCECVCSDRFDCVGLGGTGGMQTKAYLPRGEKPSS
jgi:hypothetical protein